MSDTTSYAQDKYISFDKAVHLLDVSFERITWFIATSRLVWKRDPRDGNRKLVSLPRCTATSQLTSSTCALDNLRSC